MALQEPLQFGGEALDGGMHRLQGWIDTTLGNQSPHGPDASGEVQHRGDDKRGREHDGHDLDDLDDVHAASRNRGAPFAVMLPGPRAGGGLPHEQEGLGTLVVEKGGRLASLWLVKPDTSEWSSVEHALGYLARQHQVPHRAEVEATLLESLPKAVGRILDLGTGDGRLLALVLASRPDVQAIGLDVSPPMLSAARRRFKGDRRVQILDHDLNDPLPRLGGFDAIVSSFAIHHCPDARKRTL
jgi:2-polyprenyl-3-methyl-5-hydroxy-6-metoxy-1,4-benzoquinol methylase